jgi:hypothetical protein
MDAFMVKSQSDHFIQLIVDDFQMFNHQSGNLNIFNQNGLPAEADNGFLRTFILHVLI